MLVVPPLSVAQVGQSKNRKWRGISEVIYVTGREKEGRKKLADLHYSFLGGRQVRDRKRQPGPDLAEDRFFREHPINHAVVERHPYRLRSEGSRIIWVPLPQLCSVRSTPRLRAMPRMIWVA